MGSAFSATFLAPPRPILRASAAKRGSRHQDFLESGGLKMAMPRASLLQTSSYRRKPVSRLSDACHRSRWIPAYAGMTMQWIRTGSAFSATFLASPRAGQKRIRASTCLSLATRGELRSPRFWTSTAGTRSAFGAERHSGSGALGGLRPGLRPQLAPAKVARPSKGRNQSRGVPQ